MSKNEIKPLALKKLIGQYWSIAFCEGSEGRTTDTSEADAQRVWTAIESAIDRLTAERDDLNALLMSLQDRHREVMAERDAAVADAERYRWLRSSSQNKIDSYPVVVDSTPCCVPCLFGEKLDAAIDAARSEGGV